ncbi:MAG: hypothetical protein IKZ48_06770 [Prevotella sp.]|nr:hypothetical protein [Prevotella sp.]
MKKTYIKPTTSLFEIKGKQALLQASYNKSLGTTGVDGSAALSRGGDDFWDDDEE